VEYWNIRVVDEGIVEFARKSKWPFPKDTNSILGKNYKVAVRFSYHIDAQGKVELMREYVDTGAVIAQLSESSQ
jgi:hypothetical protein